MSKLLLRLFLIIFSFVHLVHFFLNNLSLVNLNCDEAPYLVQTIDLFMLFDIVILEPQCLGQLLREFLRELRASSLLRLCLCLYFFAIFLDIDFAKGCQGSWAWAPARDIYICLLLLFLVRFTANVLISIDSCL